MVSPWNKASMLREQEKTALLVLHELLVTMFSASELRRWLAHAGYEPHANALPGPNVSLDDLAEATVRILERRGLLDERFFKELRTARPARTMEIDVARYAWRKRHSRSRTRGGGGASFVWLKMTSIVVFGTALMFLGQSFLLAAMLRMRLLVTRALQLHKSKQGLCAGQW